MEVKREVKMHEYWVRYYDSKGIQKSLRVTAPTPGAAKTLVQLALAIMSEYRPHMRMQAISV